MQLTIQLLPRLILLLGLLIAGIILQIRGTKIALGMLPATKSVILPHMLWSLLFLLLTIIVCCS